MLVDPTRAEQNAADRHVIVVMDNPKNRVIHMEASGIFPAAEFADALDLGADVCAFYDQLLRTAATSYCAAECKALQSA
jgi:ribonuclease PH